MENNLKQCYLHEMLILFFFSYIRPMCMNCIVIMNFILHAKRGPSYAIFIFNRGVYFKRGEIGKLGRKSRERKPRKQNGEKMKSEQLGEG